MSTGKPRDDLQHAWLIHRRPWRDTSAIVEVFTPMHGRLGLIARGVQGKRSNRSGLLQPLVPLLISWSGRGELGTLTRVENAGQRIAATGEALYCAMYANELVYRLLPRHDAHPVLFGAYSQCLGDLVDEAGRYRALRMFEHALLQELGYGLNLEYEAHSDQPVKPDRLYCYETESGPVPVSNPDGSRTVVRGSSLLALASGDLASPEALRECKFLMRDIINHYLGDKPLESRRLFRPTAKTVS